MMTVMVIRGCTLEGAGLGIEYYLKPDFSRLSDSVVSSNKRVSDSVVVLTWRDWVTLNNTGMLPTHCYYRLKLSMVGLRICNSASVVFWLINFGHNLEPYHYEVIFM